MKAEKAIKDGSPIWPEMTFIYVMPLLEEQNGYGFLENGG